MSNRIDRKATIGGALQVVLTPIFIVVLGTLFSLLTGYKANNHVIIIRLVVWMLNLIISWLLSTSILKIFLRKKVSYFSYKYTFLAYVLSVLFIWGIGIEESDYSYVTSALTLIAIVGVIWGIKLYKRKRGRPPKEQ
jgi:hypothetical protein